MNENILAGLERIELPPSVSKTEMISISPKPGVHKYCMEKLEDNFTSITEFNHDTVQSIARFFDLDFVQKDPVEFQQWFLNLKEIAEQNLGLAHCIVHNQSARNSINVAYHNTKLEIFNKPYSSNVGAYSFFKGVSKHQTDTITLTGNQLIGTKYWASQLNTSDYMVLSVKSVNSTVPNDVRKIFLDLGQIPHVISKSKSSPMGMNVAFPCDIALDTAIPPNWILDHSPLDEQVARFHFYGLIANYISCANSLIIQASAQGFNVEYNVKKIQLNIAISTMLWEKSFDEMFNATDPAQFTKLNMQYQFARKNLVDITSLFLEILNTGICDLESAQSQKFRDALSMSSHLVNLYKHINGAITRF